MTSSPTLEGRGTPEEVWQDCEELDRLPIWDPAKPPSGRVVVISPSSRRRDPRPGGHCGVARGGPRSVLIAVTDGENSHRGQRARLRRVRPLESAAAARRLGITPSETRRLQHARRGGRRGRVVSRAGPVGLPWGSGAGAVVARWASRSRPGRTAPRAGGDIRHESPHHGLSGLGLALGLAAPRHPVVAGLPSGAGFPAGPAQSGSGRCFHSQVEGPESDSQPSRAAAPDPRLRSLPAPVTLPPRYFDDLYARQEDPWGFRSRWYEHRKRSLTMAALPDEHYTTVFEPGSSIGVLSAELAGRADRVLAMDVSAAALRRAAETVPANVELAGGAVPENWPDRTFDLVVLSEVAYYLDPQHCQQLAELHGDLPRPGGCPLAPPGPGLPAQWGRGAQNSTTSAGAHGLSRVVRHLEVDVRVEVWSRDRRSVAARTGLV